MALKWCPIANRFLPIRYTIYCVYLLVPEKCGCRSFQLVFCKVSNLYVCKVIDMATCVCVCVCDIIKMAVGGHAVTEKDHSSRVSTWGWLLLHRWIEYPTQMIRAECAPRCLGSWKGHLSARQRLASWHQLTVEGESISQLQLTIGGSFSTINNHPTPHTLFVLNVWR